MGACLCCLGDLHRAIGRGDQHQARLSPAEPAAAPPRSESKGSIASTTASTTSAAASASAASARSARSQQSLSLHPGNGSKAQPQRSPWIEPKDLNQGTSCRLAEWAEIAGDVTVSCEWSQKEREVYTKLCADLLAEASTAGSEPRLLEQSGLPRRTLREIWQVANPEMRHSLDMEQLWLCFRLVGHCQALQNDPKSQQLLNGGGPLLQALLRRWSSSVPPQAPGFHLTPREPPLAEWTSRSAPSPGYEEWTEAEQAAYQRFESEAWASSPEFLERSGLPHKTLKEIWQVALGGRHLWTCCRLVGHCQSLQEDPRAQQLLQAGGVELQVLLRRFATRPPPRLPDFQRRLPGYGFRATSSLRR